MTRRLLLIFFLLGVPYGLADEPNPDNLSRTFEFNYGATIEALPAGSRVRVWIPIAASNQHQQVRFLGADAPAPIQINQDSTYGNSIGFFETIVKKGSRIDFETNYRIVRQEAHIHGANHSLAELQKKLFLGPNRRVPIDGKPAELVADTDFPSDSLAASRIIYDVVEKHMKYDKSKSGYGQGDSVWACNNKTGNCTDFHSLFISIARSQSIPARFEIGFPLPPDVNEGVVGGYHCWAWFYVAGEGWAPVDISEADKHPAMKDYYFGRLTADRVAFSTGRDIELVPASKNGPLNYFIYPHIEVDGKLWPKENVKLHFSFKNVVSRTR